MVFLLDLCGKAREGMLIEREGKEARRSTERSLSPAKGHRRPVELCPWSRVPNPSLGEGWGREKMGLKTSEDGGREKIGAGHGNSDG